MFNIAVFLLISISFSFTIRIKQTPKAHPNLSHHINNTTHHSNLTSNENETYTYMNDIYKLQTYHNNYYGDYLVDADNFTVYMFSKDHNGTGFRENDFNISCLSTECTDEWMPILISENESKNFHAGQGLNQSLIGEVKRGGNNYQLTYNNIPLYYYKDDQNPGDINGQLVNSNGGTWYLISPGGKPITKAFTH